MRVSSSRYQLVMMLPLLFVLMPRPEIEGIHYLIYAIIGLIVSMVLLLSLKNNFRFNKFFLLTLSLLYLYMLSIAFSIIFNVSNISLNSIFHLLKPIFFILILCLGYVVGKVKDIEAIKRGLLKSAYTILIFQVIVGITQLFDISIFSYIYSDKKARPIGELVRITGTLANPNLFAWIVLQMTVIVYLFEKKKTKKIFWVVVGILLLLFSGSRSLFILTPIVLFMINIFLSRKSLSFYFVRFPIYLLSMAIMFSIAYWFITKFGDHFPYLQELLRIIYTKDLTSVHSFHARTVMWDDALYKFGSSENYLKWLFGIGAGSISVLDNDYLYSFINYGLFNVFISILIYLFFYIYFSRIADKEFSTLGKQYILFSLIIGLQVETLSGWNFPVLIMYYTGIGISLLYNQRQIRESKTNIAYNKRCSETYCM